VKSILLWPYHFIVNRLFSGINVSQSGVATRCGGIFNNRFTVNLPEIQPGKDFF